MKAAQINTYGPAGVFTIIDIPTPEVNAGKVLVEVHASSVNPFDTALREGYLKEMIPLKFPVVLGGDIAGVINKVGEDVSDLKVGDKVYGQAYVVAGNSGAFAEFAATDAGQVAPLPKGLNFEEAASLPLVGVSALQGITEHIKLQKGQKIFIHGGSGGIGSIAIQIAKHLGAYVATTATGDGLEFVKSLGADEVIDYKAEDFAQRLHEFDAVFELAGGKDFDKTLQVLKRGGIGVSMIATATPAVVDNLGVKAISQSTKVTTKRLNALTKLVEEKVVTPQIDETYPLKKIVQAFKARESGKVKGKVAILIKS